MEEKAGEGVPEKDAGKDGEGQEDGKASDGLPRLPKKLGSKVFGMLNKLGRHGKDPGPAVKAGEDSAPAVTEAVPDGVSAGEHDVDKKEDVMEEKPAKEGEESGPAAKGEEKDAEPVPEENEDKPEPAAGSEGDEEKGDTGKEGGSKEAGDEPEKDDEEKPKGKKAPGKKGAAPAKKKPAGGADEKKEKPKESMEELVTHREEVEALLSSIEDSYREATLPDKTYREVKRKNEKKLEEIDRKIKILESMGAEKGPEAKGAPGAPEVEVPGKEGAPPAAGPAAPAAAGKPAAPPAAGPAAPAAAAKPAGAMAAHMIEDLEKRIEERLHDVIASASIEVTDKRIRKVDDRLDAIESINKDFKKAADTVTGYDKQFTLMNTEVEKTKALVDSIKEAKNITDEKLQRMTESFAELRSIIYQREAKAKEQEVLMDKLEDTVSRVDSARILREFTTRDEQLRDVNTRLEKIERSAKTLTETMNRIKGLMTDIGSLENIVKASCR